MTLSPQSDAEMRDGRPAERESARWMAPLARVPLVLKIGGANMIIVVVALIALALTRPMDGANTGNTVVMVIALAASLVVSVALALLALRPLGEVERTLQRYHEGNAEARVPRSPVADEDMERLAGMINRLLDSLSRDRRQLRQLADRVLAQTDAERSRMARDLYDSAAQSIAALMLEVSALSASLSDATQRARLEQVRQIAASVLDEIREMSHAAHPRLLEDRGLEVAMQQLIREYTPDARVSLDHSGSLDAAASGAAAMAYRVAQVVLRHAVHDRQATDVRVALRVNPTELELDITDNGGPDDGRGAVAQTLESVRHRLDLVGGSLALSMNGKRSTRLWIPNPLPLDGVDQPSLTEPPRDTAPASRHSVPGFPGIRMILIP